MFICDATRAFLDPFLLAFFAPATQPNTAAAAASYVIPPLTVHSGVTVRVWELVILTLTYEYYY